MDCRPVQRATDHTQLRRVLNQPGNSKKAPPALVRIVELTLEHPCGAQLLLRREDAPVVALCGYPLFGLTVASHGELLRWVEHFTALDVEHSAVHQAHLGWAVTVTGPELVRIQLHTDEGPSGEAE